MMLKLADLLRCTSFWALVAPVALGCGPAVEVGPVAAGRPTAVTALSPAELASVGKKWARVTRDEGDEPQAMETAIVRYAAVAGAGGGEPAQYVDLVAAVHIGDRAYYDKLNDRFRSYDAVLYELVAHEGTVTPKGAGASNGNPLGLVQNAMKSALELEHQLQQIDYTQANMVHADMAPDELLEAMTGSVGGMVRAFARMQGAMVGYYYNQAAKNESLEFDIALAAMMDDRARILKRALAKQFDDPALMTAGISGPEGSALITQRNNRALDVLAKKLDEGVARVAVFYGAGHLPEMHEQLAERFGLKPVAIEWVEAWDLRK